jgi:hypothetical protein
VLSTQMKLNISFMPSKYVIDCPWFKRWYRNELHKSMFPLKINHVSNLLNHLFFAKQTHKPSFILSMLTSKPHEVFPCIHVKTYFDHCNKNYFHNNFLDLPDFTFAGPHNIGLQVCNFSQNLAIRTMLCELGMISSQTVEHGRFVTRFKDQKS